jgi:predicted permease
MDALSQDVRYALRMGRRGPGFTAAVIISMALGIGANTAIYSLIHTLVLRPLPVRSPQELVEPLSWLPGSDTPRSNSFMWKHYMHWRDHAQSFAGLIAVSPTRLQARINGSAIEPLEAEYAAGNFFAVLGMKPLLGRLLDVADDRSEAPGAAVISWACWQRQFHGDPAVLGQSLLLNGSPVTIVGVTPRAFFGLQVGLTPDVWVPVSMEPRTQKPSKLADGSLMVRIMGRRRPDVSLAQAEAEMRVLDQQRIEDLIKIAPFWKEVKLLLSPAAAGFSAVRDQFAGPLMMLMAVAGVLLLLACANVAALFVVRARSREREISLRVAVGAGCGRLVRQLLTESLLLSAFGGAVGLVLAIVGGNLLVRMLLSGRLPPGFPARFDIHVNADPTVLMFTVVMVLITGVLFGVAPVIGVWSMPFGALREGMQGSDTPQRRRFANGLVAGQIALSVALLSGTGLLVGHVVRLKSVETGFERNHTLLITLNPASSGYEQQQLFLPYRILIERLEAMPDIASATVSAVTPVEGPGAARMVDVAGFDEAAAAKKFIPMNFVGPGYFETFGTPLIAGREFTFNDIGRPRVAIVNQAMAHYYFGADDPIGKRFAFTGRPGEYEIVGLVADVKYQQLTEDAPRTIYVHAFQEPRMFTNKLSIRTRVAEMAPAAGVRDIVEQVLKTGAVAKVTTLDRQLDASIPIERTIATLSIFFGGVGALLAALGVYGLLAYTVSHRTREIGIRMALGADRGSVLWLVLRAAGMLVALGSAVGIPIAFLEQRIAASTLSYFTVDVSLPATVAIAAVLFVALLAAYVPAQRAVHVDPMAALKLP